MKGMRKPISTPEDFLMLSPHFELFIKGKSIKAGKENKPYCFEENDKNTINPAIMYFSLRIKITPTKAKNNTNGSNIISVPSSRKIYIQKKEV